MKPVLVTTKHRGIFFGLLKKDNAPNNIILQDCRNIIYFPAICEGFLGLAKDGPREGCRIGPKVNVTLYDITSISEVPSKAAQKFQDFVWKQ